MVLINNDNYSIEDKCTLLKETFDLPVFFVNPEGKVIHKDDNAVGPNPLYENQKDMLFNPLSLNPSKNLHFPVIKKSAFSEKLVLISVLQEEVLLGTLLIGPSLPFTLSEDVISGIINDWEAFFYQEKVIRYFKSLPIIGTDKLINISLFANLLFNNKLLSPQSVVITESAESVKENKKNQQIDLAVSENLQSNVFHHDHLFEKEILYIVREGRVEELKSFPIVKEEEDYNLLSKTSYLRSVKYHIITLITLVSRASIEGGLHEEIAFSLHDRFILQLEELKRLDDIRSLAKDVLFTYTEKVKQVNDERFSRTITVCKDYIFKHIYEEISHDDIANKVELNPKYLSRLFKKEVGITVNEYIQQKKIDEAKKILAYSKTPISEIFSLLNYNDQSYFTKVFKKTVGITPKQYREKHHLLEKK
ncbi:helix-turn-helix domain-containing protein [Saliterribacillus persicus]|uniref:AraC family transcriptional regulator n=1 Tax=Saliterribacillus persicus TaxID=930114 RepID=A0A368Y9Q1_9BACI|nr:helix-turn-helix domain-containing protein [Saliterribacillus persicus]RCW77000.1 AraC family transcriptional regulator [Saliterribacillus persicus]